MILHAPENHSHLFHQWVEVVNNIVHPWKLNTICFILNRNRCFRDHPLKSGTALSERLDGWITYRRGCSSIIFASNSSCRLCHFLLPKRMRCMLSFSCTLSAALVFVFLLLPIRACRVQIGSQCRTVEYCNHQTQETPQMVDPSKDTQTTVEVVALEVARPGSSTRSRRGRGGGKSNRSRSGSLWN